MMILSEVKPTSGNGPGNARYNRENLKLLPDTADKFRTLVARFTLAVGGKKTTYRDFVDALYDTIDEPILDAMAKRYTEIHATGVPSQTEPP